MKELSDEQLYLIYKGLDSYNPSGTINKYKVIHIMNLCHDELLLRESEYSKFI